MNCKKENILYNVEDPTITIQSKCYEGKKRIIESCKRKDPPMSEENHYRFFPEDNYDDYLKGHERVCKKMAKLENHFILKVKKKGGNDKGSLGVSLPPGEYFFSQGKNGKWIPVEISVR